MERNRKKSCKDALAEDKSREKAERKRYHFSKDAHKAYGTGLKQERKQGFLEQYDLDKAFRQFQWSVKRSIEQRTLLRSNGRIRGKGKIEACSKKLSEKVYGESLERRSGWIFRRE